MRINKACHALPPQELRFMGENDSLFLSIGDLCLQMVEKACPMNTLTSLLDIGCGYGRLAHALWRKESFKGVYYGVDILPKHINFCQNTLSPLGKFNFLYLDIYNARYNPKGKGAVENLDFSSMPAVDLVTFFSVFTHMYIEDIKAYLNHVSKILHPGGKILFTAFLLEGFDVKEETKNAQYPMLHKKNENCYFFSKEDPLHAIAYRKEYIEKILIDAGFCNIQFIYGDWSPSKYRAADINPFQDLCIAQIPPVHTQINHKHIL